MLKVYFSAVGYMYILRGVYIPIFLFLFYFILIFFYLALTNSLNLMHTMFDVSIFLSGVCRQIISLNEVILILILILM